MFTRLCSGFALVGCLCLAGCGAEPGTQSQAPPVTEGASLLSGNWLLTNSLPGSPPRPTGVPSFALSVTLGGTGDQLTSTSSFEAKCQGEGASGIVGGPSGKVDATGAFALTTPEASLPEPVPTIDLQGHVPKIAGAPWTGTYTFSNPYDACSSPTTESFTAQALPSFTGTYLGTTYLVGDAAKAKPIVVTAELTQEGNGGSILKSGFPSNTQMTATLSLNGATCFSSGTNNGPALGVHGSEFLTLVRMNDGSSVFWIGALTQIDGTAMRVEAHSAQKGTCDDNLLPFLMQKQ